MVHTYTVDEIQVRQRQDHYAFVALNEGVAAAKLALVNMTAIATDSIIQLILFYLAAQKLKKVEHVEATRGLLLDVRFLETSFTVVPDYSNRVKDIVTDGVKVALMDAVTALHLEATNVKFKLLLAIIDLNGISPANDESILVIFKLL